MEKITEEQAAELLDLIQSNAIVDHKVAKVNDAKSQIKKAAVHDSCAPFLFEALRTASTSQNPTLSIAGFTSLNHLLTRLSNQESRYVAKEAKNTLPVVIEKLGDHKDKIRELAATCLTTMWKWAGPDVERAVKNTAMVGKNSRAKEAAMHWLVSMHGGEHHMQFRAFVPTLMELLEDADGMVRDVARHTVVELFQSAPAAAKSDLKRQLKTFNVRQTIVDAIMSQIQSGNHGDMDSIDESQSMQPPPRPRLAASTSSMAGSERATTPQPERKSEYVEPLIVDTYRELEDIFNEMHAFFEGKEHEQNWLKREQSCTKIRRMNAGNSPREFHDVWVVCIKGLLDGILKAVNSLRTSLSKEGCAVIQEVAKTTGPGLDQMVEILLQNLIKLCGGTKKIASAAGDATVDIIISHVSYSTRILQHIFLACQDKNVQPRTYATGWLKTLLKKEAHQKAKIEGHGGLDLVEKCLMKGLADPNPAVREKMRGTFWVFAQMWPNRSEVLQGKLDPTQLKLLLSDSGNPNSPKKAEPTVRPGLGFSKSTMGGAGKPSIRETILAQKKATMAAKNLPARPGSAMGSFASPTKATAPRPRPEPSSSSTTSSQSHGGLSVAPMRPKKFVSSNPPRPATAGPYSVRPPPNATPSATPSASGTVKARPAISTSRTSPTTMRKAPVPRPGTAQSNHSSTSPVRDRHPQLPRPVSRASTPHQSPPRSSLPQPSPKWVPHQSPRELPIRQSPATHLGSPRMKAPPSYRMSSPTKMERPSIAGATDEEMTMVIPKLSKLEDTSTPRFTSPPPKASFMSIYEDHSATNAAQSANADIEMGQAGVEPPRTLQTSPVLEEVSSNEDTPKPSRLDGAFEDAREENLKAMSPEKSKKALALIDSGIKRLHSQTLDAYGLRELQRVLKTATPDIFAGDRFTRLLGGLFEYLKSPMSGVSPQKVQDLKTQVLNTINILLRKDRAAFSAHAKAGLDALIIAHGQVERRAPIVSGYVALLKQLVSMLPPSLIVSAVLNRLDAQSKASPSNEGTRVVVFCFETLIESFCSAGGTYRPSGSDVKNLCAAVQAFIGSEDADVRRNVTLFCALLEEKVGEQMFWGCLKEMGEGQKSLVVYTIEKRRRAGGRMEVS